MKLSLKGYQHPALKSIAKDVEEGTDVWELVCSMWELMYRSNGVGLAANQVGVLDRVIVVHANGFRQEFINPVITKRYGGRVTNKEGCLSFPGVLSRMMRSKQIVVEGFDRDWKPIKRKLKGLAAYRVQHEVDHLNGKTIITK